MNDAERTVAIACALGRILRLGSRPEQPGDVEEYERCRAVVMEATDGQFRPDWTPSWARDRQKGAAGD